MIQNDNKIDSTSLAGSILMILDLRPGEYKLMRKRHAKAMFFFWENVEVERTQLQDSKLGEEVD